jgi:hypothetical protein
MLFPDETEAAQLAVAMEDQGHCVVVGVEFKDGRVLRRDDWPAYCAAATEAGMRAGETTAAWKAGPTREVLDPFDAIAVNVDADAPAWLGTWLDRLLEERRAGKS